jgi:hypothetical protein
MVRELELRVDMIRNLLVCTAFIRRHKQKDTK